MRSNAHIINRQVFEFECLRNEHAFQMKEKFDHGVQDKISKIIDRACSQLAIEDDDIRIPLLEIDLGRISFDKLEEEIVSAFEKKFYEKLSERKNYQFHRDMVLPAKNESSFEIAKFFLLTGRLPWFAGKQDEKYLADLFDEVFAAQNDALRRFILLNLNNERFIERLTAQPDALHIDRIIRLLGLEADLLINMETMIRNIMEEIILLMQRSGDKAKDESGTVLIQESNMGKPPEAGKLLIGYLENNLGSYALHLRKVALEFILKLSSGNNNISTPEQFCEVFEKMVAEKFEFNRAILHSISLKDQQYDKNLRSAINQAKNKLEENWIIYRHEQPGAEDIGESLKEQQYGKYLPDATNQNKSKQEENRITPEQEQPETRDIEESLKFYISNAGLVLIANYFPVFLNELKLLEQENFTSKSNQVKAVFLLHYLCTGREEAPEYILPLNKILCGLSLDEPLPSSVLLDDDEKKECEELLNEIIRNWQKIGNLSLEGLREAFLNRDGILSYSNSGWKLQVERKGYDILLDSLPWSYNYIKLSWMENLITTEW